MTRSRRTRSGFSLLAAGCATVLLTALIAHALMRPAIAVPGQAEPGHGGVPGATPGTPGRMVPGARSGGTDSKGSAGAPPEQAPANSSQPAASEGTGPGAGRGSWTLSDLLDGILQMERSGLKLTAEQVARIRPALVRVIQSSQVIQTTEKRMRAVLTPAQLHFIEEARRSGKLNAEMTARRPTRPGEDPAVLQVIELLQKK